MDISFIIPARNEEETLRYTIANLYKTVQNQSFEIIVVDDDSDHSLLDYLDPFFKIVYLRNSERLGGAKSRNIGALHAKGEVFVFLDAHVCFYPHWLDRVFQERRYFENRILGGSTYGLFQFEEFRQMSLLLYKPKLDEKKIYYGWSLTPLPTPSGRPNHFRKSDEPFAIPLVASTPFIIGRDLFFKLGRFEDELTGSGCFGDLELCLRCWSFGYEVNVIPDVLCFHYFHPRRLAKNSGVDYTSKPFFVEKYDHSVENALRVLYLHLSDNSFNSLLDFYKVRSNFKPDLESLTTENLRARREFINREKIHDDTWLWRRVTEI